IVLYGDEVTVYQRHVAVQHNHVALEAGQRLQAGAHGVAGAAALVLHGAFATHGQDLGDLILVGARDHDDALRRDAECGVDDVGEHGPAAHLVQHLGDVGLHARADTRRQDHDGQRRALACWSVGHMSHLPGVVVAGAARASGSGWGGMIRTSGCRDQNPVPYHLATPQRRTAEAPRGTTPPAAKRQDIVSPRARTARRGRLQIADAPGAGGRQRRPPTAGLRAVTLASRSLCTRAATSSTVCAACTRAESARACGANSLSVPSASSSRQRYTAAVLSPRSGTAITRCRSGSATSLRTWPLPITSCGPGQRKKGTSEPTAAATA